MGAKKYKICIVLLVIIISCVSLTSSNKTGIWVLPSLSVPGEHTWEKIDTEFCRLYYYEEKEYVEAQAKELDDIYKEIYSKFKHHTNANMSEDGLITFLFLDRGGILLPIQYN